MENKENTKYIIVFCGKDEEKPKRDFSDYIKFGVGLYLGYALGKSIKKVVMNKINK